MNLTSEDKRLLVELCRKVIERLDGGSDSSETAAMEVQLREIARLEPWQVVSRSSDKTEEFVKFTAEAFYKNY